jgi:competence protein ComFC
VACGVLFVNWCQLAKGVLSSLLLRRVARSLLSEAEDALASIFFPAPCRICEKLLTRANRIPICEDCLASFTLIPERACDICGQPLESFESAATGALLCPNCNPPTYAFARARSLAIYQDELVSALLILKYQKLEPLAKWFAERMVQLVGAEGERLRADLVVPVPLHRSRERERGYNQAALLAKPLAKALGLPYRPVLLVRKRPRPEKRVLSLEERWEAVHGAFATRPGTQVDKLRVLLVDDVLTTGATLDACARALLDSGAKSVVGLTVARAARSLAKRSPS